MSSSSTAARPRLRTSRLRATAVAGGVAAAVAVWLVARYALSMQLRTPAFGGTGLGATLGLGLVVGASAVASLAGWGLLTLFERRARRPRSAFLRTSVAAAAVSFSAPLAGHGATASERLALVCMHLAVAAVVIPVLAVSAGADRTATDQRASSDPRLVTAMVPESSS